MNRLREFTHHPLFEKLGQHIQQRQTECEKDALEEIRNGEDAKARTSAGAARAWEEMAAYMQRMWDDARHQ